MFYFIANSGFDKELTFVDKKDCKRFIATLDYYQVVNPLSRFSFRNRKSVGKQDFQHKAAVELVCFCLMPNSFYLLVKQEDKGMISSFISRIKNSYTRYFNTRYKRRNPIFKESFKIQQVENGEELIFVSRHIHLKPLTEAIVRNLKKFPFSSYPQYLGIQMGFCKKEYVLDHFDNPVAYEKFVLDLQDYQRSIKQMELVA